MDSTFDSKAFSLAGSFLVATSEMPDSRFAQHVIYICAHDVDGALGIAINQPEPKFTVNMLLAELEMTSTKNIIDPTYIGGPVAPESAFILYRSHIYLGEKIDISDNVFLSREKELLERIANGKGPEDYLIMLGYTGWGPGQLELEIVNNGWLVLPGNEDIIFSSASETKWQEIPKLYGVDITIFDDKLGHA